MEGQSFLKNPKLGLGLVLLLLLASPPFLSSFLLTLLTQSVIYAILAMSLDIILGYTGLASLGHAAYLGLGGYGAGILATKYGAGFWTTLGAGVGLAILTAAVFGLVALRATGVYFLMITLALGQGRSFAEAGRGAGAPAKPFGPFPLDAPPKEIPDPEAFRQAVSLLRPGEVSPLVTGQKASYLIHLLRQQDPAEAAFEKEKEAFRARLLVQKRATVFSDWLHQLRQTAKVTVDQDNL